MSIVYSNWPAPRRTAIRHLSPAELDHLARSRRQSEGRRDFAAPVSKLERILGGLGKEARDRVLTAVPPVRASASEGMNWPKAGDGWKPTVRHRPPQPQGEEMDPVERHRAALEAISEVPGFYSKMIA